MFHIVGGQSWRWMLVLLAVAAAILGVLEGQAAATAEEVPPVAQPVGVAIDPTWNISRTVIIPIHPGYPIYPGYPFPCPRYPEPTPGPGTPAPTPRPTPTPGPATVLHYRVCPQIVNRVPPAVQQEALANPWRYYGYGMLQNPSVPYHPLWNPYRTWLSILDYGKPWNPCNPVVFKVGCP